MKYVLTVLLVALCCSGTLAQDKHNLFLDAGINVRGVGITYDRKLTNHFEIGGGINTYFSGQDQYGNVRSAAYIDFRPYWKYKKGMLFLFADIGAAYLSPSTRVDITLKPVGFYFTPGIGYHFRFGKRDIGPYISAGFFGYSQSITQTFPLTTKKPEEYAVFSSTMILSLGFKL